MRERINRIFKSRAFYIIFSALASITLWVFVDYTVNEEIRETRDNIPIDYINADIVTDRQLVITDRGSPTVTVTFEGRRSEISRLDSTTVRAVVDLAAINSSGQRLLTYKLVYSNDIDQRAITQTTLSDGGYVTLTVEDVRKKEIPFEVRYNGNIAAEGYRAEQAQLSQSVVSISGPRSHVDLVDHALINVRRENLTKPVTEDMTFVLVDDSGNEVSSEMITFGRETIAVTVPIVQVKEIALDVKFIYGAGATEDNVKYEITPKTITLSGSSDTLSINTLTVATIDLTSFVSDFTTTRQIPLPDNTQNLTGISEATITVSVRGLDTIKMRTSNIQITNKPDRYSVELITESIEVTLRGPQEKLDRIFTDYIHVTVDMTGYGNTSGTFKVPARVLVYGTDGDIGAIGDYDVTVRVTYDPYGMGG